MDANLKDARELSGKLEEKADDLFESKLGEPELQVHRTFKIGDDEACRIGFAKNQDVNSVQEIKTLVEQGANDLSQIFLIRQPRSWSTLNISLGLLKTFMTSFNVFSQFWKYVFLFGRKFRDNEYEFPGISTSRTQTQSDGEVNQNESIELAYILRRVELHRRPLAEGQSPWSIRQTAIYHKAMHFADSSNELFKTSKSMFLLIAPSESVESQLRSGLHTAILSDANSSPYILHLLLVSESLKGWIDYMAWLENQLKEQSNRMVFAPIDEKEQISSRLINLTINVSDRQALKLLENSVAQLQIILSTLLRTVVALREECCVFCKINCSRKREVCRCDHIRLRFDAHIKDLELYVQRSDILKEEAKSTARLLSDLLSYENAVALKSIAHESHEENKLMIQLTERSTKDAAAVKVLTIIGLVYLPTTLVANFFSTQFVQTNSSGEIHVSRSAWLLAVIALPLTAVTVITWWLWAYAQFPKLLKLTRHLRFPTRQAKNLISFLSASGREQLVDPESGIRTWQNGDADHRFDTSQRPFWSTAAAPDKKGDE